jgi:hypothetical protein
MSFDVAIGINQAQLNSASQAVYSALYPNVFKGSASGQFAGETYTVDYDVKAAPAFDLSVPTDREALMAWGRGQLAAGGHDLAAFEPLLPTLAANVPGFAVNFAQVDLNLVPSSGGSAIPLVLGLTALCHVEVSGSTVSFAPYQVTAQATGNPETQALVQALVVPQIMAMAQSLLSGLTIPPLSVAGVSLSPPSIGIVNGSVIAAAAVNAATPPPPDGSTAWPSTPFFALLSANAIQALAVQEMSSISNHYSDSGSGGGCVAGYDWSYGLSLANPQIGVQGDGSVAMGFSLAGSVSGSVHVGPLSIGLDFNANGEPDPSLTATIQQVGSAIDIVTQSVNPFTIVVTPGGSVPDWVLGWIISAIIDAVVSSVTPLITTFLNGINIASIQIPTYSFSVDGTALSFTPQNLQIGDWAGNLSITGSLAVTG